MAIRIEYLLVLVIAFLVVSMLGNTPKSQEAKSAKGDKEIEFQNFSLYDIKQNEPAQEIYARKMVKFENYLELNKIDLQDENGYQLLSNKAIYEETFIYMNEGVKVLHDDGSRLITKSLDYNIEKKEIRTIDPFTLEFNSSIIQGENLALNMISKEVSADNIEAKIVFVAYGENTTQE